MMHSPLPWKAGKTCVGIPAIFPPDDNQSVALFAARQNGENSELPNARADRDFILLAANNHDALVEALRLLLCGAERAQSAGVNQPQLNGGVHLAKSVLAKLEATK